MKKLILVLSLLLMMTSCGKAANYIEINSQDVDMSLYRKMESTNHHFKLIDPSEISRVIDEEGSAIFYIGNSYCPTCNKMVYLMEEAAKKSEKTIYYFDTITSGYKEEDPVIVELIDDLKDVLYTDERGNKVLNTPHVLVVKNGEIIASAIGKLDPGNEDFVTYVTNYYLKMFNKLK